MASFLGNLFGKSERRVVGIDIGSSAIKVVELYTSGGRVFLGTYGSIPLGPYADVEIGKATNLSVEKTQEALQKVLDESGVIAKEAAVNIPFNSSLVSVIRLPKASEKRLDQIVPTEARKYIPANLDEVRLDWSVIEAKSNVPFDNKEELDSKNKDSQEPKNPAMEQIDILLAAIHNDSLERHSSIVGKTSLKVSFFEIEVFSTSRALSSINSEAPVAVVDIGASSSKIYILDGGMMRFSHTINLGSQDATIAISRVMDISDEEAEMVKRDIGIEGSYVHLQEALDEVFERLFSDVLKVIRIYEKKNSCNLERVVISGGGGCLKGIRKIAQERLDKSISVVNPFDRVKHPPFMKEILARVGPEYAAAAGVAMRAAGVQR